MKKIYIIGIVASGKTTMSKELSKKLLIPYYELDNVVYTKKNNKRYKRTNEELFEVINDINMNNSWIFEGVYRESYKYILDYSDTIIFLDVPLYIRKIRILKRFIMQQFNLEKSEYKSDLKMLKMMFKWTKDFETNRCIFEKMLNEYSSKLVVISNKNELRKLLNSYGDRND